jgi:hypothetical protein
MPYPPEEVQWLVAKAFNHAVGLALTNPHHHRRRGAQNIANNNDEEEDVRQNDEALRWALAALELAEHAADAGATASVIQTRMAELGLGLGGGGG